MVNFTFNIVGLDDFKRSTLACINQANTLSAFLDHRIANCEGGRVSMVDAYYAYKEFCTEHHSQPMSRALFISMMKERFEVRRTCDSRYFQNVILTRVDQPSPEHHHS